ncbi:MAG TPA: hypothetical protein VH437_18555 [Terriglobales bacterium]|jgi:DNA-directed RNA polymerase specialized sigma24 family protein
MNATFISYVEAVADTETPGGTDYQRQGAQQSAPKAKRGDADRAELRREIEDPSPWLYRDRSIALLKRFVRLAVEIGRLPSLLGREFFRTRVTSYSTSTFEDSVIFVYDVEQSLEKLDPFEQALIRTIVLEEYSQREAAKVLNCPLRTVERMFPEALDRLSEVFLDGGILIPLADNVVARKKPCQGVRNTKIGSSHYNHAK